MKVFERDDEISHVALSGRLDATVADDIEKTLAAAIADRTQSAIIDLSKIEFMASRGLGVLFSNSKQLKKKGFELILLNPQGMVDAVLKSSKMDKVMRIAYEMGDALRMLGREVDDADLANEEPSADLDAADVREVAKAAVADQLKLQIKNELSELEPLTQNLHRFLDEHSVAERPSYAIDLAIEELVVNVIRYAYVDDDEHRIEIELSIEDDQLVLTLIDDGRPFDPRESPDFNPHAEDREVGGLGLILVLDLVDTLKYQRVDEKNYVEVRVHLEFADED